MNFFLSVRISARFVDMSGLSFLLSICIIILASVPSYAQSELGKSPSDTGASISADGFKTNLRALAEHYDIAFLLEDIPSSGTLKGVNVKDVKDTITDDSLSRQQKVKKVADAYDYEAVQSDSDLILLQKRYRSPDDFPAVTYEECLYSLKAIQNALGRLLPELPTPFRTDTPIPRDFVLRKFYEALDADHLERMKKGLLVKDLSPEQAERAESFARFFYLGDAYDVAEKTVEHLKRLNRKESIFQWKTQYGVPMFGYSLPYEIGMRAGQ